MLRDYFTTQERLELATRDGFSARVIEFINRRDGGQGTEALSIRDEDGKRHAWRKLTPEVVAEVDDYLTSLGIASKHTPRKGK